MGDLMEFLTTHEAQFRKARLGALYSDFRHLRSTNPDGYKANVQAWQKGLADAAYAGHIANRGAPGDSLILNIDDELLRALDTKEWGRPLALGTVIREGLSQRELVPLEEFTDAKESIYKKSWNITPWQAVSWGLRKVGLVGGNNAEDRAPVGKFVIVQNLEAAFKAVNEQSAQCTSRTDRIMSRKLFAQTFGNSLGGKHAVSANDMDVLLKFMARDKGVLAYDGSTIKFRGDSEAAVVISSEDSTIASLKSLLSDMESQIDALSLRVESLDIAVREAVSKKNRISALASLRSKKVAESNLSRQTATFGQLEEVYSKIGQAADQVELVRIMEGSTGVLKKLNAEVGGIERVDNIVDELKEQMIQVDEINNVIAEAGQSGAIDEEEIDDELEALMAEDSKKHAESDAAKKEEEEHRAAAATKAQLAKLDSAEKATESSKSDPGTVEENTQGMKRLSLEPELANS